MHFKAGLEFQRFSHHGRELGCMQADMALKTGEFNIPICRQQEEMDPGPDLGF